MKQNSISNLKMQKTISIRTSVTTLIESKLGRLIAFLPYESITEALILKEQVPTITKEIVEDLIKMGVI